MTLLETRLAIKRLHPLFVAEVTGIDRAAGRRQFRIRERACGLRGLARRAQGGARRMDRHSPHDAPGQRKRVQPSLARRRRGDVGQPLHTAPGDAVRQNPLQAQAASHDHRGKRAGQRFREHAGTACRLASLTVIDAGLLHHLSPLVVLGFDEARELGDRACHRLRAGRRQFLADVGLEQKLG